VTDDGVKETADALMTLGAKAVGYQCDITDEDSVVRVVDEVATVLGRPGVLCNVAGIGTFAHSADMPLAQFERIVAVNLTGTFVMIKSVLPHMLHPHGGAVVNVASTAGLMGSAYSAAYCASKGGVVMMTKALAIEYADRRVRFNAVAPGSVDTPLIGKFELPEGADPKHLNRMMSRMGFTSPDTIAATIAFLASEESAYTTGAVVAVDGAMTA
ncbi:MAG TPA: SDR family NAD(P)-dependent oxidoreductase, partial [Acidimicrobiales bacterium]|nr:SDR family NAD(P)-dependent oxidoreductase [Acidimicrobiales bacterium]